MQNEEDDIQQILQVLNFKDAVSHRVHARLFEILGYLSLIEIENLSDVDKDAIVRIRELCKKLIDEIHLILEISQ